MSAEKKTEKTKEQMRREFYKSLGIYDGPEVDHDYVPNPAYAGIINDPPPKKSKSSGKPKSTGKKK